MTAHEPLDYGIDSKDITSFHPAQRDWSLSRAHRAPILTLWSEPAGSAPSYTIGYLLFNGRLMLDYAGKPIRAIRHLPLTISSEVKGFRLETWVRQDTQRLRIEDILARIRTKDTPNGLRPLHKRGDFTDLANTFRLRSGLVSFRSGNQASRVAPRAFMDSLRTAAQRASNQATDRDLTPDQLATLKELSKRGPLNAAAGPSAGASVSSPITPSTPIAPITPTSRPAGRRSPSPISQPTSPSIATVTPTTGPKRRRHPSPAPAPAPAPATPLPRPPAQTLPDSREDIPKTCKESYILNDALEETVQHFRRLTGQIPKPTNTTQSYISRWNALQMQFAPIWKSQRPAKEIPLLYKKCRWTGGIECWDPEHLEDEERNGEGDLFGESMDATAEGRAYGGPDGTWRSTRDTWCNSHRNAAADRSGRRDAGREEGSEEHPEVDLGDGGHEYVDA